MSRRLLALAALGGLAVVGAAAVASPLTAHAGVGDRAVQRYDLTADVETDGSMTVTIDMDYDFATDPGHGPTLSIPTLFEIDGDPDHLRKYEVTDVTASSPSAPDDVNVEDTGGGNLLVRIGSPDIDDVSGVQSYLISYRLRGLVNPGAGSAGEDELYWNVLPTNSDVPINDVTVAIDGPVPASDTICFAGPEGSTDPCTSHAFAGPVATFTQTSLPPGNALTIDVAYPAGTFVGAEPIIVDRAEATGGMAPFTINPVTGGGAAVILAGGALLMGYKVRQKGRDEQYLGLTPGLAPAAGGDRQVGVRDRRLPTAVQFTPPPHVRPGEMGTLVDEVADPRDVTATIVDLAVRGYLRIVEVTPPNARGKGGDWQLVRLSTEDMDGQLLAYELTLMHKIFAGRGEVTLSDLKTTFAASMALVQKDLYTEVTARGWFRANPSSVRTRWYVVGALLFILGIGASIGLALTAGPTWALLTAPLPVLGILAFILAGRAPARTAEGTAVLAQTLGFRTYLETAEAGQLRFEEGEDIFSRYLPYAIIFGVAERWAGVFARLAAEGRNVAEPGWYVGPSYGHGAFWVGYSSFGSSLNAFSDVATTSISAANPGSSGGSGFSSGGGFSGGGGGGGGGVGGW